MRGSISKEGAEAEDELSSNTELFSVSTQWDYLYVLGKVAIKYGVNYKYGVQVLSDLLGLLTLLSLQNNLIASKAKYWIAYAFVKASRFE